MSYLFKGSTSQRKGVHKRCPIKGVLIQETRITSSKATYICLLFCDPYFTANSISSLCKDLDQSSTLKEHQLLIQTHSHLTSNKQLKLLVTKVSFLVIRDEQAHSSSLFSTVFHSNICTLCSLFSSFIIPIC